MITLISTLALSNLAWDLTTTPSQSKLDGTAGHTQDIAVATQGQAVAQDVASAIKLFAGELYYDSTQGVPYLSTLFSESYNAAMVAALLQNAAVSVPNVLQAVASNVTVTNRVVGPPTTVNILDVNGQALGVVI